MSELDPPPVSRWAQVAPAETPSLRSLTTLAGSVVIVAALYFGREVLIPITLAILLSFVLAPLAGLLRRAIGRIPAVILSVLIAVTIFLALAGVMGVQVAELANDIPRYQTTIRQKVDTLRRFTTEPLSGLIGTVGREVQKAGKDAAEQAAPAAPGDRNTVPLPVEVRQPNPSPLEVAERIISPVLNPLATTAIILIVAVFILLQQEDLRDRLIRLFGSRDLHRTTVAMDDAARRLSRYFLTQLGINAAFGLIIGVGLFLIGIPSPVLWGVLATLLRFVPYVGSLMAGVIPGTARRGGQPWLVDGARGCCSLPGDRTDHGTDRRADAVWPQHGSFTGLRRCFGDLLGVALGADWPHPCNTAYLVPSGSRSSHRASRVS